MSRKDYFTEMQRRKWSGVSPLLLTRTSGSRSSASAGRYCTPHVPDKPAIDIHPRIQNEPVLRLL